MGKVIITEHHFQAKSQPKVYTFDPVTDLQLKFTGAFGPRKLGTVASDLMHMALAIYHFERVQRPYSLANPIVKIEMEIWLQQPAAWTRANLALLTGCLNLMGNTVWEIKVRKDTKGFVFETAKSNKRIDRVVLFSGGIDSSSGIASLPKKDRANTLLCSYYSRQKTLQQGIARDLGYEADNQLQLWFKTVVGKTAPKKGGAYFYRSILFLCFAGVAAYSYNCDTILQYENGVLASSIPPSPSMIITRHAHPFVQHRLSALFSNLLKTDVKIDNPFLSLTKRQCVEMAYAKTGKETFDAILERTETCWFKYANFALGGHEKIPNVECGLCIPCIIRRTAFPESQFVFDLNEKNGKWKNEPISGEGFRSYYNFTQKILAIPEQKGKVPGAFYRMLPAAGRVFFENPDEFPYRDAPRVIYNLFRHFAVEFQQTFTLADGKY